MKINENSPNFDIPEKLAFVKMIHAIIIADRVVHKKEIRLMTELTHRLNFDSSFIEQAQTMEIDQSLAILEDIDDNKKKIVADILHEVTSADGLTHDNEIALLLNIFNSIGIGSKHKQI
jgi:uncharacterized tellurite resistance protein B-like protein